MSLFLNYFRTYKDKELKQLITEVKSEEIVSAGQIYEVTVYIQNVSRFELSGILFRADDVDVSIVPEKVYYMRPEEVVPLKVIWKPKTTRETALNTKILADFRVIVRPP